MASFVPALIVVDMQEDFCPPNGSLAIKDGRSIAPAINRLLSLPFALKVATQDWHPTNSKTFASQHTSAKAFESYYTGTNPSDPSHTEKWRLWPDHCMANTNGAAMIPEIETSQIDVFVRKGLDPEAEMLSGFGDIFGRRGDHASDVDLGQTLKDRGITHVYVVGLAGDYCVKSTAHDAKKDGYDVAIIWDCTKSSNPEVLGNEHKVLGTNGIRVIASDAEELKKIK